MTIYRVRHLYRGFYHSEFVDTLVEAERIRDFREVCGATEIKIDKLRAFVVPRKRKAAK